MAVCIRNSNNIRNIICIRNTTSNKITIIYTGNYYALYCFVFFASPRTRKDITKVKTKAEKYAKQMLEKMSYLNLKKNK